MYDRRLKELCTMICVRWTCNSVKKKERVRGRRKEKNAGWEKKNKLTSTRISLSTRIPIVAGCNLKAWLGWCFCYLSQAQEKTLYINSMQESPTCANALQVHASTIESAAAWTSWTTFCSWWKFPSWERLGWTNNLVRRAILQSTSSSVVPMSNSPCDQQLKWGLLPQTTGQSKSKISKWAFFQRPVN